ncbi:MAG TPA: sporulation protein YhbH [Chloroflexota bacterium]|jgi:sporulation protein YhbH|nr:sporulation protein YhbH [Chloroflexota bacterium]
MDFTLSISKHDWSLHRKGPIDQARHNAKIKEAIRNNLPEIIAEESIITSDGKKIVKVPIRSLDLPHFRFDPKKSKHAGQGQGKSKVGDVIGQDGSSGPGRGKRAGDVPGVDYYDAEIELDELAALVFEDLGLPHLKQKQQQEMEVEAIRFNEIRKAGIMSNLDKKRTIMENIRRNALAGHGARFAEIRNDDLRFKTWEPEYRRETNAVVIAMRDVSGSMGEFEKYITRSFYFWMVRFLRTKYHNVKIVFITHHTEAKEVEEQAFFELGESGGTRVSSAYQLALQLIDERYNPERWNIYPFHFSDGDNWGDADNQRCVHLVRQLIERSNVFGYGEIQEYSYGSATTLMNAFSTIKDQRFIPVVIRNKAEVYPALRKFFSVREEVP